MMRDLLRRGLLRTGPSVGPWDDHLRLEQAALEEHPVVPQAGDGRGQDTLGYLTESS